MANAYFSGGGTFIDETGSRESISQDGTVTHETSSSGPAAVNLIGVEQVESGLNPPGEITVSAAVVAFAFTSPVDGRVIQRIAGVGTIPVAGTYTNGTPTSIQARLVLDGTATAVTGFDWATYVASPAGDAFSFGIPNAPQGGWYNVQIRDSGNPELVTTSGKVGVGAIIPVIGQSNAAYWFSSGGAEFTTQANAKLRAHGNVGSWVVPGASTMPAVIAAGNDLIAALGVPVALLDYGWNGSGLNVTNGARWMNGTAGDTAYISFKNGTAAITNKLESVIWIQGEADAVLLPGTELYYNGLTNLFSLIRSDFNDPSLPIVLVKLARRAVADASDADHETIRVAQHQKCSDPNIYRVERADLDLAGDNIHHTSSAFVTLARRCSRAVKYALGLVTNYRGPRIASIVQVSSTVYDLTLQHDLGTDFAPASGITTLRATVGGAEAAISSAVRTASNKIRVTLATAAASLPTFSHMYGANPTLTGLVKDNSSFAMPLEYHSGVLATEAEPLPSTVTGVSVTPATATGSTTFAATVAGDNSPSQAVTWSLTPQLGAITSGGVFTEPAQASEEQIITVRATSVQDGSYSGTATVTIAALPRAPAPSFVSTRKGRNRGRSRL